MSVSERIQLVEDIWDSIAAVSDSVPLTEEQKDELDRRLSAYHKDPLHRVSLGIGQRENSEKLVKRTLITRGAVIRPVIILKRSFSQCFLLIDLFNV